MIDLALIDVCIPFGDIERLPSYLDVAFIHRLIIAGRFKYVPQGFF